MRYITKQCVFLMPNYSMTQFLLCATIVLFSRLHFMNMKKRCPEKEPCGTLNTLVAKHNNLGKCGFWTKL